MTKQDVKTALKCCLTYTYTECFCCPYEKYLVSSGLRSHCSLELYKDVIKLLDGDELIAVDLDKAIQGGK